MQQEHGKNTFFYQSGSVKLYIHFLKYTSQMFYCYPLRVQLLHSLNMTDVAGSKGAGVFVACRGNQGTGALAVSEGNWGSAAHWERAARAGTMETEDSAPQETLLCSAAHHPPAAGRISAHLSVSMCIHVRLGRSP